MPLSGLLQWISIDGSSEPWALSSVNDNRLNSFQKSMGSNEPIEPTITRALIIKTVYCVYVDKLTWQLFNCKKNMEVKRKTISCRLPFNLTFLCVFFSLLA